MRARSDGGELVQHLRALGGGVVVAPGDEVVVEVALAEDLREPAGRRAAEELELEEPVLGDRVAGAPPHALLVLGPDVGDAERVAGDLHVRARLLGLAGLVERRRLAPEVDEQRRLVVRGAASRCRTRRRSG